MSNNCIYVMCFLDISKRFPRSDKISVLPEMIDKRTIKVNGSWNSFNITWKPVQNVNFGAVFYEINVNDTITKNDTTVVCFYYILISSYS